MNERKAESKPEPGFAEVAIEARPGASTPDSPTIEDIREVSVGSDFRLAADWLPGKVMERRAAEKHEGLKDGTLTPMWLTPEDTGLARELYPGMRPAGAEFVREGLGLVLVPSAEYRKHKAVEVAQSKQNMGMDEATLLKTARERGIDPTGLKVLHTKDGRVIIAKVDAPGERQVYKAGGKIG